MLQTVEGFDRGVGGNALFKLKEGRWALLKWTDAAVDALIWSENDNNHSSSSGSSSSRRVRESMVNAARERFLDDSVVDK